MYGNRGKHSGTRTTYVQYPTTLEPDKAAVNQRCQASNRKMKPHTLTLQRPRPGACLPGTIWRSRVDGTWEVYRFGVQRCGTIAADVPKPRVSKRSEELQKLLILVSTVGTYILLWSLYSFRSPYSDGTCIRYPFVVVTCCRRFRALPTFRSRHGMLGLMI